MNCIYCKEDFEGRKGAKYCSDKCRMALKRTNKANKPKESVRVMDKANTPDNSNPTDKPWSSYERKFGKRTETMSEMMNRINGNND